MKSRSLACFRPRWRVPVVTKLSVQLAFCMLRECWLTLIRHPIAWRAPMCRCRACLGSGSRQHLIYSRTLTLSSYHVRFTQLTLRHDYAPTSVRKDGRRSARMCMHVVRTISTNRRGLCHRTLVRCLRPAKRRLPCWFGASTQPIGMKSAYQLGPCEWGCGGMIRSMGACEHELTCM
jgi:hypothetical protein